MPKKSASLIDALDFFKAPATRQALEFEFVEIRGTTYLQPKKVEVKK